MIAVYILCLFGVIILAGFVVAIIDLAEDAHENWQKRVTAEDLRELARLFEQEGSFVDYNEKGEKMLVGYTKE